MFGPVWGVVLGLAFMFAVNPVLLAIIVLMISRPRPVQNLAAYWLGSTIISLAGLLIPLMLLHVTPGFRDVAQSIAAPGNSTTGRIVQLVMGALMVSVAALMTYRAVRQRVRLSVAAGDGSVLVQEPEPPITSPFGNPKVPGADGGSIFRRMLHRLQTAWEDGALWVSFVFGLGGLPPPVLVLFVVTPIVASGAPIGTQILAVIVFVVAMFAVVELTLVSYLLAPAKTLAVLQPLHNWASAYRRRILIAIFGVVGVIQLANGLL